MTRQRLSKTAAKKSSPAIAPGISPQAPTFSQNPDLVKPQKPDFRGLSQELAFPLQAKLTISKPHDKYEQEADRVADQVVKQIHAPNISKSEETEGRSPQITSLEIPKLQRKSNLQGSPLHSHLERSIKSVKGQGKPLPTPLRPKMENAFGANFNGVKIHNDSQADRLSRSIQAKAFTTGQDIFFRKGAYRPSSQTGQQLLAHELTHTLQQTPQSSEHLQRDDEINTTSIEELTGMLSDMSIEEAESALLSWQESGALSVEVGIIFDDAGNLILAKPGKARSIDLDATEYIMSGVKFGDRKVTHNHPSGSALTVSDINHAWSNGVIEMRAAGKYGVSIATLNHKQLGAYDGSKILDITMKEPAGAEAWLAFCPDPTAKKKTTDEYTGKTFGEDGFMGKYFTIEVVGSLGKGITTENQMNWKQLYIDRYRLYHDAPPADSAIPDKPQDVKIKKTASSSTKGKKRTVKRRVSLGSML